MQRMRQETAGDYSYKPFDDTRSIFVHIPKTAGVSVATKLYGNLAGGHASVLRYQMLFSAKDYRDYFKFTFVRNPWDRLYSAYNFLKNGAMTGADVEWAEKNLSPFSSFEQFVMEWLTIENSYSYTHFKPQRHFLTLPDQNVMPLDFIGYYENIVEDFAVVAKKLNRPATLDHLNKSKKSTSGGYQDQYTAEMKQVVAQVYEGDISLLGYSFDAMPADRQKALKKR